MPAASVTYSFSQRFRVSAQEAYRWCTDYEPNDLSLMNENGRREIQRITNDTIILKETVIKDGKKIGKVKLVKLNPTALSWYNIQVSGPNKYSEFLYRILPENKGGSRLTFTGLLVVYSNRRLTSQRTKQIARDEKRYDSKAWKLLARAMESNLRETRPK